MFERSNVLKNIFSIFLIYLELIVDPPNHIRTFSQYLQLQNKSNFHSPHLLPTKKKQIQVS